MNIAEQTINHRRKVCDLGQVRTKSSWCLTNISVFSKITNMNAIYKALADPTRRKILELLRDRDLSAGEIAAHFDLVNGKGF
jgi:Helix-turn-helix domain